jgi:hypothetical protein
MNYVQLHSNAQNVVASTLLLLITLIGVTAYANVFSVLMLLCLGAPALLVLFDILLGPAGESMQ